MSDPTRPRSAPGISSVLASLDERLEGEVEILDAFLIAQSRGQLTPEAWTKLFAAAVQHDRLSDLAFAFEEVVQDKRIKTLSAAVLAEFMFRAAVFFGDTFGDEDGSHAYLDRALAAQPNHAGARERLESTLLKKGDFASLGEYYIEATAHRPRAQQIELFRKAAKALGRARGGKERLIEVLTALTRLDPNDQEAQAELLQALDQGGNPRELAKALEQTVAQNPDDTAARARLVALYASDPGELEKALPHVEIVLAQDPQSAAAREAAQAMLELKATAPRAAEALAQVAEAEGEFERAANLWALTLEHARGNKRLASLKRIVELRQDRLADDAGAFEALEAALALDSSDADLLGRYTALAGALGRHADAARTLQRVAGAVRDPSARAQLTVQLGEMLLGAGDAKRARAAFSSAISTPGASDEVTVRAARALARVFEEDGDHASLADMLERIMKSDPDASARLDASQKLAVLAAGPLGDPAKAIVAWRSMLEGPSRKLALRELEPLLEQMGDARGLAEVLRARAAETRDPAEQRDLHVRAADALTAISGNVSEAASAWTEIVERFGASPEVLARWLPLLELQEDWERLAAALVMAVELAPAEEKASTWGRLGSLRMQLRDASGAVEAFGAAVELDPSEPTSRTALEQILSQEDDDAALAAASVLEPLYRMESSRGGLLRVLLQRSSRSRTADERLAAIGAALSLAESMPNERPRALDLASRGLAQTLEGGGSADEWLDAIGRLTAEPGQERRRAEVLARALGPSAIDGAPRLALTKLAARAMIAAQDTPAAVDLFRRALAFAPDDEEARAEHDALLLERGTPSDRLQLHREELSRTTEPAKQATLRRAIVGVLRDELGDAQGAVSELEGLLRVDPDDLGAEAALVDLLTAQGLTLDAIAWVERRLARSAEGDPARKALLLRLAELSGADAARAAGYARALLEEPGVSADELDALEHTAERLRDSALGRDVVRVRVAKADAPLDKIFWLSRLGEVEGELLGDASAAAEAFKAAAQVAKASGDLTTSRKLFERVRRTSPLDREATVALAEMMEGAEEWPALAELLAVLVDCAPSPAERVAALLRLANVLGVRQGDAAGAYDATARAFAEAPDDAAVLAAAVDWSARADATDRLLRALAEASQSSTDAASKARLATARARLSVDRDPAGATEAVLTLLRDESVASSDRIALARSFDADLSRLASPERRRLFDWRRLHDREGGVALVEFARFEEAAGDASAALGLFRQAQDAGADVGADVARLTLASGDVAGASEALRALIADANGSGRSKLQLELAALLVDRPEHQPESLALLREVLAEQPADPTALAVVAKLASADACRAEATALLEASLDNTTDPTERARMLRTLLDSSQDAPAETRRGWLEQLVELGGQGTKDQALDALLSALQELPLEHAWWDEAERLARELDRPNEVADTYRHALATPLAEADLLEVGQRAVAFQEEWFEDPSGTIRILDRLVDAEPDGGWAFDRLKLLYDAQERWDDLFPLYDRVLARADKSRKMELLEDAAQIAKDFAKNADRAIGYMEQLLNLKPTNERLIASLERLYERHGRYRELISLLGARLPALSADDARAMRVRMATLWLDELGDAASALIVVEELISAGDPATTVRLLERVLAAALPTDEVKKSLPSTSSPVTESIAAAARESIPPVTVRPSQPPRESQPPGAKSRGKRQLVRQRAAAFLRESYGEPGKEAELARVLEIELEAVKSAKERIRRHRELAALYTQLGNDHSALEHCVSLVMLEPGTASNRAQLEELAQKTGRFDRMADVLVAAAEDGAEEELRVQLLLQAGLIWADKVGDASRATDLLFQVQGFEGQPALVTTGVRRLDALLLAAGRDAERLGVLERLAQLETGDKRGAFRNVAQLAARLGETDRAVSAWESCLALDHKDEEALTGLVEVLLAAKRMRPLVDVLDKRATATSARAAARADRVQIAHIWDRDLGSAEEAAKAWARVESDFGESDESLHASIDLAERLEQYADLATKLERAIARAGEDEARASLHARRGDVLRVRLDRGADAAEEYRAALKCEPLHPVAMTGLHALLARPETETQATEILLDANRKAQDWPAILELTPHRLRTATDDAERVRILLEAAATAERETGDPARAFEWLREALALSLGEESVEADAVRLAELTGAHKALSDTLRELEATLEQRQAAAPLERVRMRLGSILEVQLDDARSALSVFQRVLASEPSNPDAGAAAVRVAVRSLRWDAAARVVLDRATATGALDDLLVALLEALVQGHAWESVASAVESQLAERSDTPPTVARDLEARVAAWHRDFRADSDAAQAAFSRALSHDPQNAELLVALVALQRNSKGRPLIDGLLRLSQATGGDLELLREAADVAGSVVVDRALAKGIIERSLKLATERWLEEVDQPPATPHGADSEPPPSRVVEHVDWALGEFVRIHNEDGDAERIVELLRTNAKLPWSVKRKRAMRHEAARVAQERLGDSETALALYAELFDEQPSDVLAASRLADLYASLSRPKDLLALRQRQIAEESDVAARADLRVLAARLQSEMGDADAAIETLRAALAEAPRHHDSAIALGELLGKTERYAELLELLGSQANLAETEGDVRSAVELYARAAEVADVHLANLDRAEASLARSLHLEVRPDTLDSLARVREKREDWPTVAEYLDKLASDFPEERPRYLLRLVDAFERAHKDDLARARLESALGAPGTPPEATDVLLALYRRNELFVPLADLLTSRADAATDAERRLSLLREAAELYLTRCQLPDRAVPLLLAAGELAPEDRHLKLRLAEALRLAGQVDEARDLLKGMLEAFAGRRPKERAVVHFHMARLALAQGQRQQALAELEAATKVDPANPEILRTVAELARDDGQLEKAERSYRALLAVVRRESDVTDETPIVRAEVLVELSELASRQEETERAQEILESAFEAAASSEVEARRLEQTLRAKKLHAPLVRSLEARLARAGGGTKAAEVLSELAQLLDELGETERAIDAAMRAVRQAPALPVVHERALALSRKADRFATYLQVVTEEAEKSETPRLAGDLFMRAGAAALPSDVRAAADYFVRAEKTGASAREALRALDKLYGETGELDAQEAALSRLATLELEATVRDPRGASDVLYRLAAVRLRKPSTIDEGAQLLESALALLPDVARAEEALAAISPEDEGRPAVVALLERVGREPGREATLLRALGLRVRSREAPVAVVREAAELALRLGRAEEADAMLDACETAAADEPAVAHWAALTRAKLAEDRGDAIAALELTLRAADSAPAEQARALRLSVADRARLAENNDLWTRALEHALDAAPDDAEAQDALSAAYRASKRADKLANLLSQRVASASDAAARAALRRERAALLAEQLGKPEEASRELEALLEEDPNDAEAGELLVRLLETTGDKGGLARVVARQLESAKDAQDGPRVASLAQKLGELVAPTDSAAAKDAFTLGLDWEPKSPTLLRSLLGVSTEPSERAEVMERLLEVESGPPAEKLALDLAASRAESWDDVGTERAFEMGLRAHPASIALRDKLVGLYEERGERRKLAALHETVARGASSPAEALASLEVAARIWQDELADSASAARALRTALTFAPTDMRLFGELMKALTLAGDLDSAKNEIGVMLSSLSADAGRDRGALLAQRASISAQQGQYDAALADADEASLAAPGEHGALLVELLERAAENADEPLGYRVRLASALSGVGRDEDARAQLSAVLDADGAYRSALDLLAALEERAGNHGAAADVLRRVAELADAAELPGVVAKLVAAAQAAGTPELARPGLERAHQLDPSNAEVTAMLRAIYEASGAHRELAEMTVAEADMAPTDAARFDALVRAGVLFLNKADDPTRALNLLTAANHLKPQDMDCALLVVDALIGVGRLDEAAHTTQAAIAAQKGRRSREAGALYHRLARIERQRENAAGELAMLTAAMEMDGQNGIVASELGALALAANNLDLAQKALRIVTMTKSATSMPRAEAYAHLGDIAIRQGDPKRAVMLLKRAVTEDPSQERAHELLRQIT